MKNLSNLLGRFVAMLTVGTLGALVFYTLVGIGRIRFYGYQRLITEVKKGGLIITANHPSLLETFFIPILFWPWTLFIPKLFVWSVPDKNLFPVWLRWIYPYWKCIIVDRDGKNTNSGLIRSLYEKLRLQETIIIHPEGGRTHSTRNQEVTLHTRGSRKLREISSTIPRIAEQTGATILPLYIEFEGVVTPLKFFESFLWLLRGHRMSLFVGEPYTIHKGSVQEEEKRRLQEAILTAGIPKA